MIATIECFPARSSTVALETEGSVERLVPLSLAYVLWLHSEVKTQADTEEKQKSQLISQCLCCLQEVTNIKGSSFHNIVENEWNAGSRAAFYCGDLTKVTAWRRPNDKTDTYNSGHSFLTRHPLKNSVQPE